ncbi:MAG: nitronate monooxygenase [Daejeonella sp.]
MNSLKKLFDIEFPIIQAGMVWCSGWRLASAVSNAGGLGLIGAGSMYPEILRDHIRKCKAATSKPFGVNVPLLSKYWGNNGYSGRRTGEDRLHFCGRSFKMDSFSERT